MISILISVYSRENPSFLDAALNSLTLQTIPPTDIVIVCDGKLTDDLYKVMEKYEVQLPIRIFSTGKHLGLAEALNFGIKKISNPWIMRFDSDDVCLPNRIQLQESIIKKNIFDICGSQIEEFQDNPDEVIREKRVPIHHDQIVKYSTLRNPFNHMTVCFRKELAESVGCYPTTIPLMEDYALWLLMMKAGAICANAPESLVRVRVGNGMIARRGGLKYILSEIKLQKFMVNIQKKTMVACFFHGIARMTIFLTPKFFRSVIYHNLLRKR